MSDYEYRSSLATFASGENDGRAIAARNLVLVTKPADLELEKAAVVQAHEDVQRELRKFNELVESATDVPPDALHDDMCRQNAEPVKRGDFRAVHGQ